MIWNMSYKKWHSKPPSNRGDYRGFVQMLRQMVIGVRYLNFMGFGHADLSGRNVLCNPAAGKAVVIDMDGLVVTNFMKGAVGGTPGFMAPELVDGYVPGGKPASPTNITDRHALAVLIFQVLLWRHPLVGKRPPFVNDLEQDNLLQQTTQHALYVHHPTDRSNAVAETNYLPIEMLPKEMQELFAKTFIGGLRNPSQRPHPDDWESALKNLERDLIPCANPACEMKYFPSLDRTAKSCTFCGAPAKYSNIILATLTVLHHTGKGSYPLKGKLTQKKEVIKRTDTLTRAALFGKSVPDREKSVLQMTHDGTHWQVILQDNTIQVTLLGDSYQHLTPKRLSVGRQTVWNLQQVALITMSQLNVTCLVKLE